jgi:small membrane protein
MSAIQIVLVAFAVFAFSRAVIGLRRGTLTVAPFVLWSLFWAAVVVVALRPETTAAVARVFGVGRGADLAIYLALMLVFFLLFRLFAKIEDLERQLTQFVRAQALKDLDKP